MFKNMIALIDYGIGNLRSVQKALEHVGAQVELTEDPKVILAAQKVVLPGVGAFGDGMKGLRARGLVAVVHEVVNTGTPLLGICVGMQVLFEESEEMGTHEGLGILKGRVKKFIFDEADSSNDALIEPVTAQDKLKVPQTGWNQIKPIAKSPLFTELRDGSFAYFNHSYYCAAAPSETLAVTDYGADYPSIVGRGRVYGIQFHPEKSQAVGLRLLKNFVGLG
jgi:imidazole glycerol-phosphate synthase subunit HisH